MSTLSSEATAALKYKVELINLLQKLVLQDRISLKGKRLADDEELIARVNESIREHLLSLLEEELGLNTTAVKLSLPPERAELLESLLDRLEAKTTTEPAPEPEPEAQVALTWTPPATPAPKRESPVLSAAIERAGGVESWKSLEAAAKSALIKVIESEMKGQRIPATRT